MCGIVGAVSKRNIVPVLLEGLQRLEYRGYDSCGVAVFDNGELKRARSTHRVYQLREEVEESRLQGYTGVAHTRWATHGAPATHNAHPHFSSLPGKSPRVALVHNGIIENHEELRDRLQAQGYQFDSQTDTEVIAHLVHSYYEDCLFDAVKKTVGDLKGAYAIAVFCKDEPHRIVVAKDGSPLVLGLAEDGICLASDALALAGFCNKVVYLEDGDLADLSVDQYWLYDKNGSAIDRAEQPLIAHSNAVELGPYRHYMQKEIFEQPKAVADTLDDVHTIGAELFGDQAFKVFQSIDRILILACGTSYYAGMTAKYWLESIAKIPVSVEIASEYRYRDSVPDAHTLVVAISQSGETADTLAALKHAQSLGMQNTLAICNVSTSAMVRASRLNFITRAGVEVGVASTKAFTTQLTALFLLSLTLAEIKGHLTEDDEKRQFQSLRHLPAAISAVLALEPHIINWAQRFASCENALFLGRGLHFPIAMEGALKLKEISYIHAEAYPAGELKHGPLALVTEQMPVVTIAPNDALLEKLKSNMQEVRARGGELYVFADADTRIKPSEGVHVIRMPEHYGLLSPILHTVPLQLLAYHTACARGTDVDKPRNLAKSVTVE